MGRSVDDRLEKVAGDHVRVVDKDGPTVDKDEHWQGVKEQEVSEERVNEQERYAQPT